MEKLIKLSENRNMKSFENLGIFLSAMYYIGTVLKNCKRETNQKNL